MKGARAELKLLKLSDVADHPDNPRLVLRDDVIDGIAVNLDGEYPQKHAIHVRPQGDVYQTLAGHHRRRAAEKAGLSKIWAWVEPLDDAAAFMELALSNNQGELSPLEIGMHALKAVPPEKGGRGKKGGLSEYAKRIGKTQQYVSQIFQAAQVLMASEKPTSQLVAFLDKAQHLAAIHALPEACWPEAVGGIGDDSAMDVRERVQKALEYGHQNGVTAEWKDYLPKHQCMSAVFNGTDPLNFNKLSALASKVATDLKDHPDLVEQWSEWLIANASGDSYDMRKVQARRIELEQVVWDREHAEEQPDTRQIQVLLADPPWQYDFAETDNRQIENQYPTATPEEIGSHINSPALMPRPLADDCVLYLWATAPKLREAMEVMTAWGFSYKTHAVWDKDRVGMGYWFRGQHELLLVGTRGNASPPDTDKRFASVFRERRDQKHSAKPDSVYDAIRSMFPDAQRFEMYQRQSRDGWPGAGNEAAGQRNEK